METHKPTDSVTTAPNGVGGAVGVDSARWYVAIVNHNSEKATAQRLAKAGYTVYVATQEEMRLWRNGRRAMVERVVIPSLVFIRCTERERLEAVKLPYIYRFMTNKAATPQTVGRPVAVIPDVQIEQLRFMLGHSDSPVMFAERPLAHGDKVRVIRGGLRGLEGEVVALPDGKSQLQIRLDILGCATVQINTIDLEHIV
ncbi:MAG: UpxY family transcription antiterminator [Muribaculaceae bacterium]|nr:UpxY family transcription antiterminator [Muribaculaceae bacterium]